jgi:hypothetical protein
MFEQEMEMEQRQASVVPLLLIVAMILTFVGVAAYYVVQNGKVLSSAEASGLIAAALKNTGPDTTRFSVGLVTASVRDRPHDPNYRLLEKAGLLKVGQDKGRQTPVVLTPAGQDLLRSIPGVTTTKDAKDASELYVVPIADRKLVSTPKVTMTGMGRAMVEFSWAWEPNRLGQMLDVSGPLVKSFNTWDRATLIERYGAKFYGKSTKTVLACERTDSGWRVITQ